VRDEVRWHFFAKPQGISEQRITAKEFGNLKTQVFEIP
jgi:hypothetical protein